MLGRARTPLRVSKLPDAQIVPHSNPLCLPCFLKVPHLKPTFLLRSLQTQCLLSAAAVSACLPCLPLPLFDLQRRLLLGCHFTLKHPPCACLIPSDLLAACT